jgi:hypothetical protein
MERDFVGYANTPPVVPWPDGARLAVQVSVSYEEGAEYSLLDGPRRETMGEVPSPFRRIVAISSTSRSSSTAAGSGSGAS